jgi:hypothetical protein
VSAYNFYDKTVIAFMYLCLAPSVKYLVHDCYVKSERTTIQIIDSNGYAFEQSITQLTLLFRCEIDGHFIETPNYSKFTVNSTGVTPYVFQVCIPTSLNNLKVSF